MSEEPGETTPIPKPDGASVEPESPRRTLSDIEDSLIRKFGLLSTAQKATAQEVDSLIAKFLPKGEPKLSTPGKVNKTDSNAQVWTPTQAKSFIEKLRERKAISARQARKILERHGLIENMGTRPIPPTKATG